MSDPCKTVTHQFEFHSPQGLLSFALKLPDAEISLPDFCRALFDAWPAVNDFLEENRRGGPPVSCRKGCGACCRQLVTISPAEAFLLERLFTAMPPERAERITDRFQDGRAELERAGILARLKQLNNPETSNEEHHGIAAQYFRLAIACPFLEDESCGIYESRPWICREYAVTSPARNCADPFGNSVHVANPPVQFSEALKLLCAHLLGTEIDHIPILLALDWIKRNSRALQSTWPAEKLISLFLQYVELTAPTEERDGQPEDCS